MNKADLLERFKKDLIETHISIDEISILIDKGWHIDEPEKEDRVSNFKEGDLVSIKNYPAFRIYHVREGKYWLELVDENSIRKGYTDDDLALIEPAEEEDPINKAERIGDFKFLMNRIMLVEMKVGSQDFRIAELERKQEGK